MPAIKLKISQLAKELGIKNKEILDLFADDPVKKNHAATLEPEEFDFVLDTLTKNHSLDRESFESYLDGKLIIETPETRKRREEDAAAALERAKKAEEERIAAEAKAAAEAAEAARRAEEERAAAEAAEAAKKAAEERAAAEAKAAADKKAQTERLLAARARLEAIDRRASETAAKRNAAKAEAKARAAAKSAATAAAQQKQPATDGRVAPAAQQQGAQHVQAAQKHDAEPQKTQKAPKSAGIGRVTLAPSPGATPFVVTNPVQPKPKKQQEVVGRTRTGATRVVDTRGGAVNVDLSKYDERLDKYVPPTVKDIAAEKQKLKKQNTRDNYARGRDREKERLAMEKLRRANKEKFAKIQHHITVPDEISVGELASRLKATVGDVIKRLMKMGVMASVNETVDYDTAYLIADEMGVRCEHEVVVTIEEKLFDTTEDAEENLVPRSPVVCVMGHVDHGKTSLLDAIRHTNVTEGEAGGITQAIGAYRVHVRDRDITFLDTPGHEAFTAMRARGAKATDIAILVVAADDGIMPQTVEAINHAKAAGVEIIVAINKIDKPAANPDQVKQELTKYDLVPEEWGGDVMCVPVSAITKQGIDDLLDSVLLVADIKEYKANPDRRATGVVIESRLDKGRGAVATVLVQNGTLHTGDVVIAGTAVGRVRAMMNDRGETVKTAGPSVPVEIVGLAEVPQAGEMWSAVEDEKMARELAEQRREKAREEEFKASAKVNLEDFFSQPTEGQKQLNVIIKADVDGSAEAVKSSLLRLSNEEVKVSVIHSAVGGITENDVMFASASNAIIIGFNVRPDKKALDAAERQGVDIRTYRIIYECIEEISAALKGMLAPTFRENLLGHAEVRQTIHVPNVGTVAGSYVQDGKVARKSLIRIVRDGVVIFEDKIASLRRFKDDVSEVAAGYECGIGLEKFNDIKIGDILESYVMEEVART